MKLKQYLAEAFKVAEPIARVGKRYSGFAILRWFEDKNLIERDVYVEVRDAEGVYHRYNDELQYCEYTEEYFTSEADFSPVYVGSQSDPQYWSAESVDYHAFWCSEASHYFSDRDFDLIEVEGEDVCQQWCEDENRIEYDEEEDEWFFRNSRRRRVSEATGRSGYHSDEHRDIRSSWRDLTDTSKVDLFGVELELLSNDTDSLQHICKTARSLGFLPDEDGSLDCSRGVEIVAPPLPLHEFVGEGQWSKFLDAIRGHAIAWDACTRGTPYGIHINITGTRLTRMEQMKFIKFFLDNKQFCQALCGRKSISYGTYDSYDYRNLAHLVRTNGGERCSVVSLRTGSRVEVRAFRATLNPSSFAKNVQFIAALMEFVRCHSLTQLHLPAFANYISSELNRKRYNQLCEFIHRKMPKVLNA
jgi:hypothetical protein